MNIGCLVTRLAVLLIVFAGSLPAGADDGETGEAKFSAEAATIFSRRCTACHTYGKGVKVGPDLKGVTERRKQDWLLKFIYASSSVIKSGDPVATRLFAEFKQQRMPDWTDLSEKQISDILDYLAVGGPDIKPADEKNAETATPAEIERGRQLFYGQRRFKYGAEACITCHTVEGAGWHGGTLGPDLTDVYVRYRDQALTAFLRHPCFQWNPRISAAQYLTVQESFAIKSFVRQAALISRQAENNTGKTASAGERRTKTRSLSFTEQAKGESNR